MPIRPPNLDDRRYEDILREARALIPQYTPEWTNLSDADPGMTLVQLFSWMTEMIIFRLNQVPDKTYIHFLNFIGEERKPARPAAAPVTFMLRQDRAVEIPPHARCATRQREDSTAVDFVTVDGVTVHPATVTRVMSVRGGQRPAVREIPFSNLRDNASALLFGGGRGVDVFDLDPIDYGPEAYTPDQFFYIAHDDFRIMDLEPDGERPLGRLRVRRSGGDTDNLSVASFFSWEYPSADGWMPIGTDLDSEESLGLPETNLVTAFPGILQVDRFGSHQPFPLPEAVASAKWWIRGRLDYERWIATRMQDDLEITWRDDRGGEERPINNWEVRPTGRTLEFFLQDVPPIKGGWVIRFALVDRGVPAGRNGYLPRYRWYYRRGEGWEEIPRERVRTEGTVVLVTGPLTDMATDGYNLRAERIETVFLQGFIPELETELTWVRPIELDMACGDDPRRLEPMLVDEGPWSPFQIAAMMPPTIGRKWYIGSDLFENRKQEPVVVEIDVSFEMNGTPVPEPDTLYLVQLTYRAEDNWRVVWSEDKIFSSFTFAMLDPAGAKTAGPRTIRLLLDPKAQLKGLARHEVNDRETTWLRMELVKSSLTGQDEKKQQHPIVPKILAIRLGVQSAVGAKTYDQPLPGPRMAQVDDRPENPRLTRAITRAVGRLSETYPFFPFVEIKEENQALYFQFDRPLPPGKRHVMHVRTRGEAYLPEGAEVQWELLEAQPFGRFAWRRLHAPGEGTARPYQLTRTGTLEFPLPDTPPVGPDGFWLRARFALPARTGLDALPQMPPITHVLLNTVEVANLVTVRTERFSGLGVPNQAIQLRYAPIFLHDLEHERSLFARPELFPDIVVFVEAVDGSREEWVRVPDGALLTASKDDRIFVVDPTEGTLTFGNGIRGRMLPVGSANVIVDTYRVVPGAKGNVGAGDINVVEGFADVVKAENLLPASGGRDAETIDEIIRRAPSLLTSRDRAVTQNDFAIIAQEASGEVARAACDGKMGADGTVEIVVLPRRREGESFPDPLLGTGLRDHVQAYLKKRCLINVYPVVRLARAMQVDVSVTLRLRPNANLLAVREASTRWTEAFLDPYIGGLDGLGWPFKGTLYAQDFARMVADIPDVRHVIDVQLYPVVGDIKTRGTPGWEGGEGVRELGLPDEDLFSVRRVRIKTEEVE
ncbi:MAG: baseplate J/gp47 family protein [Deltaproteobacteria bacterium]|nr:baseplate J/gp47 family protein [Deltaproteobacteria bacterium]